VAELVDARYLVSRLVFTMSAYMTKYI